jgi:hypothetical protein
MVESYNFFVIYSKSNPDIYYEIKTDRGIHGNIDIYYYDKRLGNVCCAMDNSEHDLPYYDHYLAQKVWIETKEDLFMRYSNISPRDLRPGLLPPMMPTLAGA